MYYSAVGANRKFQENKIDNSLWGAAAGKIDKILQVLIVLSFITFTKGFVVVASPAAFTSTTTKLSLIWGCTYEGRCIQHVPLYQSPSDTDEEYYFNLVQQQEENNNNKNNQQKDDNDDDNDNETTLQAIQRYRDEKRQKEQWNRELEQWKRLGIQARRNQRDQQRKEKLKVQAQREALFYLRQMKYESNRKHDRETEEEEEEEDLVEDDDDDSVVDTTQLQLATAFFTRLMEHVYTMEREAYQRGKERAIQREMELVMGNTTTTAESDTENYLEEVELIREAEQEYRQTFEKQVLVLPENWKSLDDTELLAILRIRGNVKHVDKIQKRETIEQYIEESFAKPLF